MQTCLIRQFYNNTGEFQNILAILKVIGYPKSKTKSKT